MHDELLAHQQFLDRLARRLVADEGSARDLVQETWLRALAHPPRDRGALRTWLATVARRLAWREQRGRGRRTERERAVARPEAREDELGAVDRRLDAQALVLAALRRLPEEQRIALTLRYADDLEPPAIAERLGVSVNTVKARLRRGLVALRADLDRATGGDRSAWALALLPSTSGDVALAASATGGGLLWTGILMATATKAAAAAAVLAAALGVWLWRDAARGPSEPDSIAAASSELRSGHAEPQPALESVAAPAARTEVAPERAGSRASSALIGSVTGRVILEEGDENTRQVALFAFDEQGTLVPELIDTQPCAPDGGFRLRSERAGKHALCALAKLGPAADDQRLRPATRLVEITLGESVELEPIVLDTSEVVRGRVVWADGTAVFPGYVRTRSGFDPRLLPQGGTTAATRCQLGETSVQWNQERFVNPANDFGQVRLDPDGAFRLVGLEPRGLTITGYRSIEVEEGLVPNMQNLDPNPRSRAEVTPPAEDIVLILDVAPVRFRAFGNGAPLKCWLTYRLEDSQGTMQTSDDGHYDLLMPEQRVDLEFVHVGYLRKRLVFEPLELVPGSVIDVHLEAGPPTASLVLRLPEHVAARLGDRRIDVAFLALDDLDESEDRLLWGQIGRRDDMPGSAWIRPSGGTRAIERYGNELSVDGLEPGRYRVLATPRYLLNGEYAPPWLEIPLEIELAPGERAVHTLEPELGGRFRIDLAGAQIPMMQDFDLEDAEGRVVQVRYGLHDPTRKGNVPGTTKPMPGLNQTMTALLPGLYQLYVRRRGETLLTLPIEIRADETTDVAVDLSRL